MNVEACKTNFGIISLLRFPLIVGVVFIHTLKLPSGNYPYYDFIFELITNNLCAICVPLFFFFSGYLFFINIKKFDKSTYINKLKRRCRSLLLPYVFWNLFFIAVIAIGQAFAPSLFTGSFKTVSDLTLSEWGSLFYKALGSDKPIAFQLWFLRDLMLMVVITPIIYYFFKWMRIWWIILPVCAYVLYIPGIMALPLFYFCMGSYFGLKNISFCGLRKPSKFLIISLYLFLVIIELFFLNDSIWHKYIHRVNVLIGCLAMIQITSLWIERNEYRQYRLIKKRIFNSSFFIYCYHGIFSLFLCKMVVSLDLVNSDVEAVVMYFAIVLIIVSVGVLLYCLLDKIAPRFLLIISGGR